MHFFQRRTLLERVHRRPKSIESYGSELSHTSSPGEGVCHEIVARVQVVEDRSAEDEIATINPHVHVGHRVNAGETAVAIVCTTWKVRVAPQQDPTASVCMKSSVRTFIRAFVRTSP